MHMQGNEKAPPQSIKAPTPPQRSGPREAQGSPSEASGDDRSARIEIPIHPAARLVREMSPLEYAALKADVERSGGLIEAIRLYDGQVLDGRHRLRACRELGIEPVFEDVAMKDPVGFVLSANVARRHLGMADRARLANKVATRGKGEYPRRQKRTGADLPPATQAQAARQFGVSERTMQHVKAVDESGDQELIARLDSGEITPSAAYGELRLRLGKPGVNFTHPNHGQDGHEWHTPPHIIEAARRVLGGIDLDPFSCAEANETVKADVYYTEDDDGFSKEWTGRVWINPPFGQDYMERLPNKIASARTPTLMLTNDISDTSHGHELLVLSCVDCRLRGSVRFLRGQKDTATTTPGTASIGQTIYGFHLDAAQRQRFVEEFGPMGYVASDHNGKPQVDRRERDEAAKQRREELLALPPTDGLDIRHCSCRGLADIVDAGSVDVICTDPPYGGEHLDCRDDLADFAVHALKPGGQLVAMSGQYHLPDVLARLGRPGLVYRWMLSYESTGDHTSVMQRRVNAAWKPVLVFVKGKVADDALWVNDKVLVADGGKADQRWHKWGQSEAGVTELLRRFVHPGLTVCDPFIGGGTTAVVARGLGCSFVGCDIDTDSVSATMERLGLSADVEAA